MSALAKALIEKVKASVKDMLDDILIIYGEKGLTPFKRPLTIAAPSLLILYLMVYSPVSDKVRRTVSEEKSMTAIAQFAGDYESVKTRVTAYKHKLPLAKDKDEWLNYLLTSTAREAEVSVDSMGAQRENEVGNYLVVSREVTATTTYAPFGRWIAKIENSPIFLRVTEMNLRRDDNSPGMVKVTFTLSTVFPRSGGG